MEETQNYQNHVRWFPLQHFVIAPLLFLILIWQIVRLIQDFNWDRIENLLVAIALILVSLSARLQALTVQNRVVRLEEKLRYTELLPPEILEKALTFPMNKIIALRFASDEELSELVQRTLNNEFKNTKEIKMAVKNWRGDYLRA